MAVGGGGGGREGFFFNDTATTEIYTLSLHDALPISDAAPMELYTAGDGKFEFERTVSRLMEMQSEAYLAQGHGTAT